METSQSLLQLVKLKQIETNVSPIEFLKRTFNSGTLYALIHQKYGDFIHFLSNNTLLLRYKSTYKTKLVAQS